MCNRHCVRRAFQRCVSRSITNATSKVVTVSSRNLRCLLAYTYTTTWCTVNVDTNRMHAKQPCIYRHSEQFVQTKSGHHQLIEERGFLTQLSCRCFARNSFSNGFLRCWNVWETRRIRSRTVSTWRWTHGSFRLCLKEAGGR